MALGMVQRAAGRAPFARVVQGGAPSGAMGGAKLATLVTTLLLVGCAITARCPDVDEQKIELPNGIFSPAVVHRHAGTVGAPFFTTTFPRGATDPTLEVSTVITDDAPAYRAPDYPHPGEAISSALLRIDHRTGVVLRSYRNEQGQLVEEAWRMQGIMYQRETP